MAAALGVAVSTVADAGCGEVTAEAPGVCGEVMAEAPGGCDEVTAEAPAGSHMVTAETEVLPPPLIHTTGYRVMRGGALKTVWEDRCSDVCVPSRLGPRGRGRGSPLSSLSPASAGRGRPNWAGR